MVKIKLQKERLPVPDKVWQKQRWAYRKKIPTTPSEDLLWHYIKDGIGGYKFERNYPHRIVHAYMDFFCKDLLLAIEADGEIHYHGAAIEKDAARSKALADNGILIVRFNNSQIEKQTHYVLSFLKELVRLRAMDVTERTKNSGADSPATNASDAAESPSNTRNSEDSAPSADTT